MSETLPACPITTCTFAASEENPTGHHWHNKPRMDAECEEWHFGDIALAGAEDLCGRDTRDWTRCYSAHVPTEPAASLEGAPDVPSPVTYLDAATGQYVTAEHAATNPATTVREDDSRVRELERRVGELQRRLDAVVALLDQGDR